MEEHIIKDKHKLVILNETHNTKSIYEVYWKPNSFIKH